MKSHLDLSGLKSLHKKLSTLESKEVEWGFLEGNHSTAKMPYAELASMLEWGTRGASGYVIPPRPAFTDLTSKLRTSHIRYESVVKHHFANFLENPNESPYKIWNISGEHLKGRYQESMEFWVINGSQNTSNAPFTVEMKGFDQPYVDTGELIQNVQYKIK